MAMAMAMGMVMARLIAPETDNSGFTLLHHELPWL